MRFLLFNIVVIGALFYLFTSNSADIRSVAQGAQTAADRAATVASDAVDRINTLMQQRDARNSTRPVVEDQVAAATPQAEPPALKVVAPAPKAAAPAPKAEVPAPLPLTPAPHPENLLSGDSAVPPPAAPATDSKKGGSTPSVPRTRVAEPLPPAEIVPQRQNPAVDPATTSRLLAADASKPVTPAAAPATTVAAASGSDIEIAKGEKMMSPRERRRELSLMAEDMELLYLKTVGK